MTPSDFTHLLERQLDGGLDPAEEASLTTTLREHDWAKDLFVQRLGLGAELHQRLSEDAPLPLPREASRPRFRALWPLLAVAALLLLLLLLFRPSDPAPIAELLSSENAAWESPLPTTPGSLLPPGFLRLKSGIATLRFTSGAEVCLEAPAHLVLESPMRARLLVGVAMIDVPDSAIGFIMDTPRGYAVDHGTRFSVSIDPDGGASSFEVISGEISVHDPASGEMLLLTNQELVVVGDTGLSPAPGGREDGDLNLARSASIRLSSTGPEQTHIRDVSLADRIHPHFLMAKRSSFIPSYDRRAQFAVDLTGSELSLVTRARLQLNLVDCGLGFASRLPAQSSFTVYGRHGASQESDSIWSASPGEALGSFSIPRSQQAGTVTLETPELAAFVAGHLGQAVSFVLLRNSDELAGNGLVHAFASRQHPQAAGPILELWSASE